MIGSRDDVKRAFYSNFKKVPNSGDLFAADAALAKAMTLINPDEADVIYGNSIELRNNERRLMPAGDDVSALEYSNIYRHGSSLIRTAVQQYKECQLRVRDKIRDANSEGRKTDPDAPLDAVVSDTDLEKMAKLSQTIREKADAYLEKKAGSRFNSYTNSRKAVARIARSFGEYRETVREEERQTQEKQLQAAETKSKRMLEKQKQNQNQMLL